MCGHFGWYIHTNVKSRELAVMAALMGSEMETRGPQSFGYYQPTVKADDGVIGRLIKDTGPITEKASAIDMARGGILIAHTRQATTGAVIADNSHPFFIKGKERTVVGAHNGTIQEHDELNKTYSRDYAVDSQHIFGHIADGLKLAELHGYGAIVYMTSDNPGKVFLGRFNSGQLSIWGIGKGPDDCTGVVWASTERACTRGLRMAGIAESFEYECKNDKLYYIERGRLHATGTTIPIMPSVFSSGYTNSGKGKGWNSGWKGSHGWRSTNNTTSIKEYRERRVGFLGNDSKTGPVPPYACQECGAKNESPLIPLEDGWLCQFCFGLFCKDIAEAEAREEGKEPTTDESPEKDKLPAVYAGS